MEEDRGAKNNQETEGVLYMGDGTRMKATNGAFVPRRTFARLKGKPFRTNHYVEMLAHYDAELRQAGGPIMVVRRQAGTELPLEHKGKLIMVRRLLDEFTTIDAVNQAIADCKSTQA